MSRRLKVLLSAYACEPGKGSEPGIGWNIACEMAKHHDVWALTRANNRAAIESALRGQPVPGLNFIYYDLPRWAGWWKSGQRGVNAYYYLWQIAAFRTAHELHRRVGFDVVHHLTFVRYWMPTLLPLLGVPFVWGPVGGAEFIAPPFYPTLPARTRWRERARRFGRWLGEHDPLVAMCAKRARWIMATTVETQARLRAMGVESELYPAVAVAQNEVVTSTGERAKPRAQARVVTVGRLDAIKGLSLVMPAVAQVAKEGHAVEYWIVGDGPEHAHLERLAHELGIAERVRFTGAMTRDEVLRILDEAAVLINLGLRESGGAVSIEAMARGCPVITLAAGGGALLVPQAAGIPIAVGSPSAVVAEVAAALRSLLTNREQASALGRRGRDHVMCSHVWRAKAAHYAAGYERLLRGVVSR